MQQRTYEVRWSGDGDTKIVVALTFDMDMYPDNEHLEIINSMIKGLKSTSTFGDYSYVERSPSPTERMTLDALISAAARFLGHTTVAYDLHVTRTPDSDAYSKAMLSYRAHFRSLCAGHGITLAPDQWTDQS